MQGVGGYGAWRWIFIIEGLATIVSGTICYFFIPDWPETARFLNPEERAALACRLAIDSGEGEMMGLNKASIFRILKDIKIYLR